MMRNHENYTPSGTLPIPCSRYKGKAITILRDIDDLGKGADVEEEIEKQVLELRQGKGRFCPQCGARCQEDDRFCSHCGANLSKEEVS